MQRGKAAWSMSMDWNYELPAGIDMKGASNPSFFLVVSDGNKARERGETNDMTRPRPRASVQFPNL